MKSIASQTCPSRLSPSPMMQNTRLSEPSSRAAAASPAAMESPCPSDPVAAGKNGNPSAGLGCPSISLSIARSVMASSGVIGRRSSAFFPIASPNSEPAAYTIGAGMSLRQHQAVGRRTRRVGRVVSHVPVHQCGHDVGQARRRRRVARIRRRRHLDRHSAQLDSFCVKRFNVSHGARFPIRVGMCLRLSRRALGVYHHKPRGQTHRRSAFYNFRELHNCPVD